MSDNLVLCCPRLARAVHTTNEQNNSRNPRDCRCNHACRYAPEVLSSTLASVRGRRCRLAAATHKLEAGGSLVKQMAGEEEEDEDLL